MLKNWFDTTEVEEFGRSLAMKFSAAYPMIDQKKESVSGNKAGLRAKVLGKQEKVLGRLTVEVRQFGQEHSLNVYKKAKLGNAFKWGLLELGYEPEFVDLLTKEVILALK